MAGNKLLVYLFTTVCLVSSYGYYPQVTLRYGGQLSGERTKFRNRIFDNFLGVRYAKPPTGDLRFKKPQPLDPWNGVKQARHFGNVCIQTKVLPNFAISKEYFGNEDCLYLNIYVPGGVNRSMKKPVMIWIHGGGYIFGSGLPYLGAPLAAYGDVIVVTINYRLHVLGFLSESLETGNFGLWDQRAAIQWVKDNIEVFGGDANRITIFGESVGGVSIAAQMIGQQNDGLFQRGIVQSGSVYQPWIWFTTEKKRLERINQIKNQFECGDSGVYDCLRKQSVDVIMSTIYSIEGLANSWSPVPDGDFFPSNVENESYNLSRRFDVMAGFTGQEGGFMMMVSVALALNMRNESINDGISSQATSEFLGQTCNLYISSQSPELCTDFIIRTYGLDQAADDKDRLIRLSYFLGEFNMNADIVNLLNQHSHGGTKTYAYTFTPYVKLPPEVAPWTVPEWAKLSADHTDELPFVFGSAYFDRKMLRRLKDVSDPLFDQLKATRQYAERSYYTVSRHVMTMWTNFAKTGNPNQPVPLQKNIPVWPEFDKNTQKFMKISENMTVITTPEKERLEKLQNILFPVRTRWVASEKIPKV